MRRLIALVLSILGLAATPAAAQAAPYSCGGWADRWSSYQVIVQGAVSCADARAMTSWWRWAPNRSAHQWPRRFWWCYDVAPNVRWTTGQIAYCRGLGWSRVALYQFQRTRR